VLSQADHAGIQGLYGKLGSTAAEGRVSDQQ
jgi:hypothetical protein